MNPILAIVGPTGVGKSDMAIFLAENLGGEIVNADSRQIYRYMDIGTAKPSLEQRRRIKHHLIDVVDPDQDFSLALYQHLAYQAISEIQKRGKLPVLVGGTGLYVWSVIEGWRIPQVPPENKLRNTLEEKARTGTPYILYNELLRVDPESARSIGANNTRRIIRALEVFYTSGTPLSALKKKEDPGFQTTIIGLTAEREELYRRIDKRVENMVAAGLVEETRSLLQKGYSLDLSSMSGIGYFEIGLFLKGELELDAAIEKIKTSSHNYARHQYAWFRLTNNRIHWFDITRDSMTDILSCLGECRKGLAYGRAWQNKAARRII